MADRRDLTIVGFALLGAGGLMLLQNSSTKGAPPKAPPPPTGSPPDPPPPNPPAAIVPIPVVQILPPPLPPVKVTWYQVRNLDGTVRFRTSILTSAIATAVGTRAAGVSVWMEGGGLVYIVPGAIANRVFGAPPAPIPPTPPPPAPRCPAGQIWNAACGGCTARGARCM